MADHPGKTRTTSSAPPAPGGADAAFERLMPAIWPGLWAAVGLYGGVRILILVAMGRSGALWYGMAWLCEGVAGSFLVYRIYRRTWTWATFWLWVAGLTGAILAVSLHPGRNWTRSPAAWTAYMLGGLPFCVALAAVVLNRSKREPQGAAEAAHAGQRPHPTVGQGYFFIFLALGLFMLVTSIAVRDVLPLLTYRPVEASVHSVTVVEGTPGRHGRQYRPRVEYEYVVAGQRYLGTRVTPADLKGKRAWAEDLAATYHPGEAVTAYYDPARPEQAFLRHSAGSFWGMLAVSVPMMLLCARMAVKALRRRRDHP
jgi:hypothetical protein